MITIEIRTFEEWNWPFIACDYAGVPADDKAGEAAAKYKDCILAGAIIDDSTTDFEIEAFINHAIGGCVHAIMVDHPLLENDDRFKEIKDLMDDTFINCLDYEDSHSYDLRLSYILEEAARPGYEFEEESDS